MYFNDDPIIDLDELVAKVPSFRAIMSDGIVTSDEIKVQSERLLTLLKQAEQQMSPENQNLLKKIIAETNALNAIYHYHELQKMK